MTDSSPTGMERMQRSMTGYVKSLTKVKEADDKEKLLPIAYLGNTMVLHADDFEPESEFGQCLSCMPHDALFLTLVY